MKKKTIHIIVSVLSWAFTAFCLLALIFAAYTFLRSKQTGERPDIFGYRAVYVLTGSMEPSMKTDSIVITKAVSSLDELKAGDIITYHTPDTEGRTLTITHRIKSIQADGTIHIINRDYFTDPSEYDITYDPDAFNAIQIDEVYE